MVFWWTGRGYLALLTLIGVYGAFGALVTLALGNAAFERYPWLWGFGALLSAVVDWWWGRRINRRSIRLTNKAPLRSQLIYRARNRFVSLPMETWAIPMAGLGLILIGRGLLFR